jgi:hypothetical protein
LQGKRQTRITRIDTKAKSEKKSKTSCYLSYVHVRAHSLAFLSGNILCVLCAFAVSAFFTLLLVLNRFIPVRTGIGRRLFINNITIATCTLIINRFIYWQIMIVYLFTVVALNLFPVHSFHSTCNLERIG